MKSQIESDLGNRTDHGSLVFCCEKEEGILKGFQIFCPGAWMVGKTGGAGQGGKMMTYTCWKLKLAWKNIFSMESC